MAEFAGKVVLVTGGTSGIGAAIAGAFAAQGARVALTGRSTSGTDEAARIAGPGAANLAFFPADLRDEATWTALPAAVAARFGGIDVLVNNAGVLHKVGTLETSDEQWLDTMHVNLDAPFVLSRECARRMRRRGGGAIVNVSSEFGLIGAFGTVSYCVSKAAVVQMTRAMALDLAPFAVRVNAICPGDVHTPMLEAAIRRRGLAIDEGLRRLAARAPVKRVASPTEIAPAALYLASPAAASVTGIALAVDGGVLSASPGGVADGPARD